MAFASFGLGISFITIGSFILLTLSYKVPEQTASLPYGGVAIASVITVIGIVLIVLSGLIGRGPPK